MEVIFDKAASHGAGRGWSVRSRETLKALATRLAVESPESLKAILEEKTGELAQSFAKAEGVPCLVQSTTESVILTGLGRRSITLWSEGTGLGGFLKWKTTEADLLSEIFG